jgi:hypothetical protein
MIALLKLIIRSNSKENHQEQEYLIKSRKQVMRVQMNLYQLKIATNKNQTVKVTLQAKTMY